MILNYLFFITLPIMTTQRLMTLVLITSIISSPLNLYAQSTGDTELTAVTPPSQTTIFLADPSTAKSLTSESVENTYYSQKEVKFDEKEAEKTIASLNQWVDDLRTQIRKLDRKYWLDDAQYLDTRKEVVNLINEIEKTKDTLSSSLTKIVFYKNNIAKTAEQVNEIRRNLDETKDYLKKFTVFMYKINNEYYDSKGSIDELKLFIKSEGNVSEQLANTAMIEQVMEKMNTLLATLTTQEKETIKRIKESNKNRSHTRSLVGEYQDRLTNLKDQTEFLSNYLTLYESNKQKISKEFSSLFDTKKDMYKNIATTLEQINKKEYDTTSFDIQAKLQELADTKAYAVRDTNAAPLSRPLYPVVSISKFFGDKDFEQEYGIPYNGVEIPAPQRTPLYAVDEWLVYKIANKDGIWLNWALILHKNNLTTLYLYPNDIIVNEWDIVRRGQIIGYSGGEPGTKWAGFISGWPNLTFMVVDNGEFVNPLDYLDISVVQNKSNLPSGYKFKYLKDKYNLPRDMYAVKPMEWNSVAERRENFLKRYGVSVYRDPDFWYDAADGTNVDPDVGICIAFAESTLWQNLTTSNNIGNVGNNDRWDRVAYDGPSAGARLIYTTLNNGYLWHYHILLDYNWYWNKDGKIYASSEYNWQNNVTKCLSQIKWYPVPDDYPVRTAPNPNV